MAPTMSWKGSNTGPWSTTLGGPESVLSGYRKIWEGHLEQFSEAREALVEVAWEGMFYREFFPSFDWEHVGEGMAGWYWYGMARPREPQ